MFKLGPLFFQQFYSFKPTNRKTERIQQCDKVIFVIQTGFLNLVEKSSPTVVLFKEERFVVYMRKLQLDI